VTVLTVGVCPAVTTDGNVPATGTATDAAAAASPFTGAKDDTVFSTTAHCAGLAGGTAAGLVAALVGTDAAPGGCVPAGRVCCVAVTTAVAATVGRDVVDDVTLPPAALT